MLSEGKEEIFLLYATDVIPLKPVEKVAGKRQPHSSWEGAEADETLSSTCLLIFTCLCGGALKVLNKCG